MDGGVANGREGFGERMIPPPPHTRSGEKRKRDGQKAWLAQQKSHDIPRIHIMFIPIRGADECFCARRSGRGEEEALNWPWRCILWASPRAFIWWFFYIVLFTMSVCGFTCLILRKTMYSYFVFTSSLVLSKGLIDTNCCGLFGLCETWLDCGLHCGGP